VSAALNALGAAIAAEDHYYRRLEEKPDTEVVPPKEHPFSPPQAGDRQVVGSSMSGRVRVARDLL
jgi:hypothetical protein